MFHRIVVFGRVIRRAPMPFNAGFAQPVNDADDSVDGCGPQTQKLTRNSVLHSSGWENRVRHR